MFNIVTIFILFFTFSSHGTTWDDARVYQATKDACTRILPININGNEQDKLRAGYFPSKEFSQLLNYLSSAASRQAISNFDYNGDVPEIEFVLRNSEFSRALMECYPRDPLMRNFFVSAIKKSSLRGRFAAAVLTVVFFKGTGYLLSVLNIGRIMLGKWIAIGLTGLSGEIAYETFSRNQELQKKTDVQCGLNSSDAGIVKKRSQCLADSSLVKATEFSSQLKKVEEADSKFLSDLTLSNSLKAEMKSLKDAIVKEKNKARILILQSKLDKVILNYNRVELSLRSS